MVRALASHARGRRFESYCLYHLITNILIQSKGLKMNDICSRNRAFLIFGVLLVIGNWFELRKTNVTAFVTADITPFSLLNKIEQEVFDLIENNPKITRKEIAIKINKTIRTVQRITDKLVDKKMLIRVGSNQYGYWEVIKKIRS